MFESSLPWVQFQLVRDFYENTRDSDVIRAVKLIIGSDISRDWVRSYISKLYEGAQKYIRQAPDIMAAKVMVRKRPKYWFGS